MKAEENANYFCNASGKHAAPKLYGWAGGQPVMKIERFTHNDIETFLRYASAENWISTKWELKFLLGSFPEGCFKCTADGLPIAFVTSIKYDKCGWIGNLIVDESRRGEGIGSSLMVKALEALRTAGSETVWLTASADGKPIYERLGFRELDVIDRWKGTGLKGDAERNYRISLREAITMDSLGWGDRRDALLSATFRRGKVFAAQGGFLVIQGYGALAQGGPWICTDCGNAPILLDAALAENAETVEIAMDVPGKNSAASALLLSRGFAVAGRTSLMFLGAMPAYRPEFVFALGSMGSMG
jgi:ribosomal protein S18 acetylase RimI-like enzyme